jgi:hypothetical protein
MAVTPGPKLVWYSRDQAAASNASAPGSMGCPEAVKRIAAGIATFSVCSGT